MTAERTRVVIALAGRLRALLSPPPLLHPCCRSPARYRYHTVRRIFLLPTSSFALRSGFYQPEDPVPRDTASRLTLIPYGKRRRSATLPLAKVLRSLGHFTLLAPSALARRSPLTLPRCPASLLTIQAETDGRTHTDASKFTAGDTPRSGSPKILDGNAKRSRPDARPSIVVARCVVYSSTALPPPLSRSAVCFSSLFFSLSAATYPVVNEDEARCCFYTRSRARATRVNLFSCKHAPARNPPSRFVSHVPYTRVRAALHATHKCTGNTDATGTGCLLFAFSSTPRRLSLFHVRAPQLRAQPPLFTPGLYVSSEFIRLLSFPGFEDFCFRSVG